MKLFCVESFFSIFSSKNCEPNKKCVTYNLCSENGDIITDGYLMIDERLGVDTEKCPTHKVCCRKKDLHVPTPDQKCKNYETAKTCGYRNSKGIGTRVKPVESTIEYSQYGEFPWAMAVMNHTDRTPKLLCGGSLIHPKIVLTAAHHVARMPDIGKITVRGGEYNTQVRLSQNILSVKLAFLGFSDDRRDLPSRRPQSWESCDS